MQNELAVQPKYTNQNFLIDYDSPQLNLIKQTYAAKATPQEFELLLYQSRVYGLDILTRKIWCVKYGNSPAQIFAGRDGFLEIAHNHRSKSFDGMETTVEECPKTFTVKVFRWEGYGENAKKVFFDRTFETQFKARTQVWRKDMTRPFVVEVWEEEYSTGMDNWDKKRRTMISKVAESQCLRKAFSISGMYAPEELGDDNPQAPDIQVATVVQDHSTALDLKTDIGRAEAKAEDVEEEENKRLRFLRGQLNQALLATKDEKAYRKVNTEFTKAHGKGIWGRLTGHDATETFNSLSLVHYERVKEDPLKASWPKRMAMVLERADFTELEAEYNAHPDWRTDTNDEIINDKGAELGIPGYEREEK